MAEEETKAEEEQAKPKSSFLMTIIVSAVLSFVFGGLGYLAVSFVMAPGTEVAAEEPPEDLPPAFVEFEEMVASLGPRMTRYLRVKLSLQVNGEKLEEITADVEANKPILRNWLITYLSELQIEDVQGAEGKNRIRRDVHNYFNDVLSPEGFDVIDAVLFLDFQLQ